MLEMPELDKDAEYVIDELKEENQKLRSALTDIIECSDIETAVQEIARQALDSSDN